MKEIITILATILLSSCAEFEDRGAILNGYIQKRDCSGAENYARHMAGDDGVRFFGLGVVYIDCFQKKREGIEYLKYAAQKGNQLAVEVLIKLGETPPEPPKVIYQERIVQQPIQQPQQIIIQQGGDPNPFPNMNKCIKDGGSIMCR